ncbi:hypothetical protein KUV57_12015 [Epibacterium sp. DP7N7-1]|nr:hypothetical protein [Epibacterium sp. DP7N7-1]
MRRFPSQSPYETRLIEVTHCVIDAFQTNAQSLISAGRGDDVETLLEAIHEVMARAGLVSLPPLPQRDRIQDPEPVDPVEEGVLRAIAAMGVEVEDVDLRRLREGVSNFGRSVDLMREPAEFTL